MIEEEKCFDILFKAELQKNSKETKKAVADYLATKMKGKLEIY